MCLCLQFLFWSPCLQDVVFVYDGLQYLSPEPQSMGKWDLFCVCDGHGGPEAADFVRINLPSLIAARLPKGPPPETESEGHTMYLKVLNCMTCT